MSFVSVNSTLVVQPAFFNAIFFAFSIPIYLELTTTELTSFCKLTSSSRGNLTTSSSGRLLFFIASSISFALPSEILYSLANAAI